MTDANLPSVTSDLSTLCQDRLFRSIMTSVADLIAVVDAKGYRIYNRKAYQNLAIVQVLL